MDSIRRRADGAYGCAGGEPGLWHVWRANQAAGGDRTGYYDCPLEALSSLKRGDGVVVETRCGCASTRTVFLQGAGESTVDDGR
jgi:hypothetical protein